MRECDLSPPIEKFSLVKKTCPKIETVSTNSIQKGQAKPTEKTAATKWAPWRKEKPDAAEGLYFYAGTETKLAVDTSRGETLRINKHDIIKKRLDSHGNVIEARQDGIGAPKIEISVYKKLVLVSWLHGALSDLIILYARAVEAIISGLVTTDTPLALPNISDSFSCLAHIEKPLQRHGGRLEHNETYCGSFYGAETSAEDCCNSCEEVHEAYRKKGWAMTNPDLMDQCKREGFLQRIKDEEGKGCNIYGFLEVNKVAGNFHFAPGKSFQQSGVHVHDLLAFQEDSLLCNGHKKHQVGCTSISSRSFFGTTASAVAFCLFFLSGNSLGNATSSQAFYPNGPFILQVVPTVYIDVSGYTIPSNQMFFFQFSVNEHFMGADIGRLQSLPGVFVFYDLSPIKVTFTEEHVSFLHFLTNVCAIVGDYTLSLYQNSKLT
ncbi:hypothetical protein SADUNF_Sadunf02G0079200 [Salix dunnii]|uniref:Endoplasmic reticulum vesicle transporter C-terminal domain-containing protein n=1 Tax=Salix dunnii TaxID=1413687 RepID=A0A835TG18_9ROSI|nr:hypothetical protein SADUNF_Sadunf02G0079200 [Salix dunnii]